MNGMMVWLLLIVSWMQAALLAWTIKEMYQANKEKEEAINWCAAHMLYEKEKGYPLMESDHMGSYYRRATEIRRRMKAENKKRKEGGA